MRVRLTARALADAKRMKTWWRRNRSDARDLFEQELNAAIGCIVTMPNVGNVYEQPGLDAQVRRLLMPKTRNHVYYVATATEIVVLTVWGARKGRGPKLQEGTSSNKSRRSSSPKRLIRSRSGL